MQGYAQIGEWLRIARQERRLSLRDIADNLHIKSRYINALESGDFEGLPGLPYIKGYIKRYADYLALDSEEIIRRFDQVTMEAKDNYFFLPHSFSHSQNIEPRYAIILTIPALILLIFWLVFVRPDQSSPSPIDNFYNHSQIQQSSIQKIEKSENNSEKSAEQYPCSKAQIPLYPPCYENEYSPETDKSILYSIKP